MSDTPHGQAGPNSFEGKARSRLNAIKHGATATETVAAIVGEEAFASTVADLRGELCPRSRTEEERVGQIAQAALASNLAGTHLRAVVRDLASTLDDRDPSGQPLDRKLARLAEASAFQNAARYDHAAASRFAKLLNDFYASRERRGETSQEIAAPPPLAAPATVDADRLDALREALADETRACTFLATARVRSGATDLDPDTDEARAAAWKAACALPVFARSSVEPLKLFRLLAEWLADPDSPIEALRSRSGINRRQTCVRLCHLLRRDGQPLLAWVAGAFIDFLQPP